jgi:ribosomal protein S18 acetylase RimI-like enzyme
MIGQWLPRRQPPAREVGVEPLTVADIGRLELGWQSMFTAEELRQHLMRYKGRSFWIPATREYVVGGHWRHRRQIGSLVELGVRGEHRAPLVTAFLAACAEDGCPLVIFNDASELRHHRWYQELGFELIQEIIVYELHGLPATRPMRAPRLRFERITAPTASPELLEVDHRAFPFLWWNSEEEFENYLEQPHVRIYLGRDTTGEAIAYAGITLYQGWGHLDRLAVLPERQGKGYGLEALTFAADQVYATGARRLGLSTQADNERSQELYERFGFHRSYRTDYKIYGHWLVPEERARRSVMTAPHRP